MTTAAMPRLRWPEGKRFALTIFDDPDSQTMAECQSIYGLLSDLGLRTTMGVWSVEPGEERRNSLGPTCADPAYRAWAQELQRRGFEIGFHSAAPATMNREEVIDALDRFREYFGNDPVSMANHYNGDAIYWGPARLSGLNRFIYQLTTLGRSNGRYFGQVEGHPYFWGDVCKSRIQYCRNFVFRELNTLKMCPWMPYHDPERPMVNYWYASAEAAVGPSFLKLMTEEAIDRLEEEGGAAIVYTHFGRGFFDSKTQLNPAIEEIFRRLAKRQGWFVPVSRLLQFLADNGNGKTISPQQRGQLERRWLNNKIFYGTS